MGSGIIQHIISHPVVTAAIVLLVIEQVLLSLPGSFPYRYGIPVKVKRLGLPVSKVRRWIAGSPEGLRYRMRDQEEVLYLSSTYPAGTWGPVLFVGEVRLQGRGAVVIRMAHVTSLFFFIPVAAGLARFDLYGLVPALLAALFGTWLYRRFNRAIDKLVRG